MNLRYIATAAIFLSLGFVSQSVIAATTQPQQPATLSQPAKRVATCITGFAPTPSNFDTEIVTSYTCRSAILTCAKGTIGQRVRSNQSTITYTCGVPKANVPAGSTSTSDDWNVSPN